MSSNSYILTGIVLALVIALIIYLARRNKKDLEIIEKEMNLSEMKPQEHKDDSI